MRRTTPKILQPMVEAKKLKLQNFLSKPDRIVIGLDLDNVLYPTSQFAEAARVAALRAMISKGLNVSEIELYSTLKEIVTERGANYLHHFDALCRKLGINNGYRPMIVAAAIKAYHDTKEAIQSYPEIEQTLALLSLRSDLLVVISEGLAIKQWDKLLRLGLDGMIYEVFVTGSKNVRTYERVVKELGVPPSRMVMVGDSPSKDILPAKEVGMSTVRVKRGRFSPIPCPEAGWEVEDLRRLPEIVDSLRSKG